MDVIPIHIIWTSRPMISDDTPEWWKYMGKVTRLIVDKYFNQANVIKLHIKIQNFHIE